jgi:hypothetical protein
VNFSRKEAAMIMVITVITITGVFRKYYPVSKAPRQSPLVLLMEVRLREGKEVGSVKCERLGSEFCYEPRKAE